MNISLTIPKISLSSGLYIVATPIGNLKDITLRALEVLQSADVVMCEDTRVSQVLLSHYGINTRLEVYNDNDGGVKRAYIIERIEQGQSVALVSDAGTPLISDPGFKLVCDAYKKELFVTSVPGASSVIMAMTLSGIASDKFYFGGFFAHKNAARRKQLQEVKGLATTLVFFERKSRLKESLAEIQAVLGEREVAIVREVTKKYEEVILNKISYIIENINSLNEIKGEIVIVVSPLAEERRGGEGAQNIVEERVTVLLQEMSLKKAVKLMAEETSFSKSYIYNTALRIQKEQRRDDEV